MDTNYNDKLKAIMKKHNTDVWNEDCWNDPDYKKAYNEKYGIDIDGFGDVPEKKISNKKIGAVSIGSYKYKSKKK